MSKLVVVCLAVAALTGCTVGPEPAGFSCTKDSECEPDLRCYSGQGQPGGGCLLPTVRQCSKACASDADCASLPPPPGATRFSCVSVCGGADGGAASYCYALKG